VASMRRSQEDSLEWTGGRDLSGVEGGLCVMWWEQACIQYIQY
jgi:hypothetical protein